MAQENLKVAPTVVGDLRILQAEMRAVKGGRQVTYNEVIEELLRVYRHVTAEANQ